MFRGYCANGPSARWTTGSDPRCTARPLRRFPEHNGAPSDLRDQIITVCAEKLADYKVIREVIILDDMPRSILDKILKVDLRGYLPAIET